MVLVWQVGSTNMHSQKPIQQQQSSDTTLTHKHGLFGTLATLILALKLIHKQRLFQCCICLLQYSKISKKALAAFAEISASNKPSYTHTHQKSQTVEVSICGQICLLTEKRKTPQRPPLKRRSIQKSKGYSIKSTLNKDALL